MKKIFMIMFSLTMVLILTACGGGKKGENSIDIAGSTSVQPLSEELSSFYTEKTGVIINVAGGGSSAGVKAAVDGIAEIGSASRNLKPEEEGSVVVTTIALDGIAVIVNSENHVKNLTLDELKGIFTGEITNWLEVGGEDAPITIVSREDGSGTRDAFDEMVLGENAEVTDDAVIENSTGAIKIVVKIDPNAIGYTSLGAVADDESLNIVAVEGVKASNKTVQDGTYPISRPFNYLTKGEPQGKVKEYIDWVLSEEGQKIVAYEFVPLKK